MSVLTFSSFRVALLAEGVDRNQKGDKENIWTLVALLAEGVDRNSIDLR